MSFLEYFHEALEALPTLAKFAVCMMLIVIIPRMSRRVRLPEAVGLLLAGVLFGPHVLDIFPPQHPILQFFAEVGMLLLMFFAGLEIDLTLFRQKIFRSLGFGVVTTALPLLLGTLVTLWLGYDLLPAIVVGSLLASHTMLGSTIVARLGARRLEPMVVVDRRDNGFRHPVPARLRGLRALVRQRLFGVGDRPPGGRDRRLRPARSASDWVAQVNTCCGGWKTRKKPTSS